MAGLILRMLAAGTVFFMIVPAALVGLSGTSLITERSVNFAGKVELPDEIEVWLQEEGRTVNVDFEEYVACVTASEMPSDFHEEALRAQSVAARTYAAAKIQKYGSRGPAEHPQAPVCDTVHCQVYRSESRLEEIHGQSWMRSGWEKVCKAADFTSGELLYYQGELVSQPLFFSSSGGQTENSEDVFVSAVPYLISVSSPYEEEASHRNEETVFTVREFKKKLEEAFPEEEFGTVSRTDIKILSRTSGGRVDKMQIGDVILRGTQVRTALGLSSSLFSISFREGSGWNAGSDAKTEIVFTSDGSGHGVGMSQYGADGMGKKGYNYKEILKHYYSGTEIY